MYKNNCSILVLSKGSSKFTISDFTTENPSKNHNLDIISNLK